MLHPANPNAAECYQRAAEARRLADGCTSPDTRKDYVDIERRWLRLAQSYEYVERLTRQIESGSASDGPRVNG
jgi:hypothetical protein